jgi:hypothetical protein
MGIWHLGINQNLSISHGMKFCRWKGKKMLIKLLKLMNKVKQMLEEHAYEESFQEDPNEA